MARLPRLVVPGHAHLVLQRGHNGQKVFVDAADRAAYLSALEAEARSASVAVHAWALHTADVLLLATPATAVSLARLVQGINRRYVPAFNRRHARSGTLWDGRFRCGVVEPGPLRLAALLLVDSGRGALAAPAVGARAAAAGKLAASNPASAGTVHGSGARVDGAAETEATTSAPHRLGREPRPWVVDLPEYWRLGNTPFDREAAYARLLEAGVDAPTTARLLDAAGGGWAAGSAAFCAALASGSLRPTRPRRRGRPSKSTPA